MSETKLIEAHHRFEKDNLIHKWEFIENGNVRLYHEPNSTGFNFYAALYEEQELVPGEEENWHPKYTTIDCMFEGTALFDGVRHIYFGAEQTNNGEGYFNYPRLDEFIWALRQLDFLVKLYCE